MMRPDSLLMYRQKKECRSPGPPGPTPPGAPEGRGSSFVRRLFQGSMRGEGAGPKTAIAEEKAPSRDGDSHMSWSNGRDTPDPRGPAGGGSRRSSRTDGTRRSPGSPPSGPPLSSSPERPGADRVDAAAGADDTPSRHDDKNDPWRRASPPPPRGRAGGGLRRSRSDLQLRGSSSSAPSETERFFDYCGLDGAVVERLGRDNFLCGASSLGTLSLALRSVAGGAGGSEPSEFSRHSGDGLLGEELAEQPPAGVSIIERNARVIKWLYGCKNAAAAATAAAAAAAEGPRESTV